ncbi:UNVERIFIED_CONTAM: hypothetical protein Sradi_3520400 [Sesamum radiatum]|uniref:Uncharacterized protein n=1 Tax=Sesamum radiatum TaxID=300843 RepID=A0AAW2QEQ5_SESRA
MPPKNTQALEEAVLAISERLSEISASMEQRHKSLAAAVSDIQHHLTTLPSPTLPSPVLPRPAPLPPHPCSPPRCLHLYPNLLSFSCYPLMVQLPSTGFFASNILLFIRFLPSNASM